MRSRQAANAVRFVQVGFGDGGESDDGVHRGADVVGHVGEELRLRGAGGLREGERFPQVGLEAVLPFAVAVHERKVHCQRHGHPCHEHHRPAYCLPPPVRYHVVELPHRLGRLVQDARVYTQEVVHGRIDGVVHEGCNLLVGCAGVAAQGNVLLLHGVEGLVALLQLAGGVEVGVVRGGYERYLLVQVGVGCGIGALDVVDSAFCTCEQRPVGKGSALHEQRLHAPCRHGHGVGAVLGAVYLGAYGHHVVDGYCEEQRHQ